MLLDGAQLPCLHTSKHFVNLTNGLELVPLLQQLELPFSFVRIRSTSLEQQAFEALMLELDANLLLALALGHSCIVWDAGCRNRKNGAPRALWYGLEFVRFALHRSWCGGQRPAGPAHVRGHNVAPDFEQACRSFHPSTKTRLRYYRRYVSSQVAQRGVQLAGAFTRTEHDEDVDFFVGLAQGRCGPQGTPRTHSSTAASGSVVPGSPVDVPGSCRDSEGQAQALSGLGLGGGPEPQTHECLQACPHVGAARRVGDAPQPCRCWQSYECLVAQQVGLVSHGLGHTEYRQLQQGL